MRIGRSSEARLPLRVLSTSDQGPDLDGKHGIIRSEQGKAPELITTSCAAKTSTALDTWRTRAPITRVLLKRTFST
jgi:hypothetical protein